MMALRRFVEAEMRRVHGNNWERVVRSSAPSLLTGRDLDLSALLAAMVNNWESVFRNRLSPMDRALTNELRATRNRWAHQELFSAEDTQRALDTISRLLRAIGATTEAERIEFLKPTVNTERTRAGGFKPQQPSAVSQKRRWSAMPPLRPIPAPSVIAGTLDSTLDLVVRYLNDQQIRATYGAVAEVVGGIAQSIGKRLGPRRVEASWIVNASTGLPTGYHSNEMHPALQRRAEIITSGDELRRRLEQWNAGR